MHPTVLDYVLQQINIHGLNKPEYSVLEIGSRDVNGSVRPFFDKVNEYIGLDIEDGPGVDVVGSSHDLLDFFGYNRFDIVVSTEVLEHDSHFWLTMMEISLVLKSGGYFILTARGATRDGRAMWEHDYPHDYWRFMPQSFPWLFDMADCVPLNVTEDTFHPGWLGIGRKP